MTQISILGCGWLGLPLAKSLLQNGFSIKGSTTSLKKIFPLQSAGITPFLVRLEEHQISESIADFLANPPTNEDSDVARLLGSLLEFPKPLIAAVKGNAVGVGTTMLLHCDVVIAGPTANFSMPFASLGLVPEAGSSFLFPQLVGYQRAARIFMTGESFDADAAIEMGLVTAKDSDPLAHAVKIAQHIAEQPPQAIINTKALLKAKNHDAVAAIMKAEFEIFAMALQSDEAMEAFMKFMSKKGK